MHNQRFGIIWNYHVNDNLGVRDPKTNRIVPHLATSWKPVEPTVWEVELRKDVKFHNGDPFDAETVKWNWERVINPEQKSQQKGNHEAIKGVEVVDPHKVRVSHDVAVPGLRRAAPELPVHLAEGGQREGRQLAGRER